ncbi:MAG: TIGR02391 family protein [Methanoregula sp.]|nr:TIGR02391 family protein [Methanoregula sp.]
MSGRLFDIIPDSDALLALEPEELAGIVLEFLNSLGHGQADQLLNTHNFSQPDTVDGYPQEKKKEILKALMEAWSWLDSEGLIAPRPGCMDSPSFFISRRGKKVLNQEEFRKIYHGNLLPKHLLHSVIAQKVRSPFIRGAYDSAVFEAFRELEIFIREAGGFSSTDFGEKLIRKAFDENSGSLTDLNQPKPERLALQNLFVAAYGSYRNPQSHRNVSIDQAEAVEMIMLASHLYKIVETRHGARIANNLINNR